MNFMMAEIRFYYVPKGWGYLRQIGDKNGVEAFFHISSVCDRVILQPGDIVVFQINPTPFKPGRIEATNVRLVKRFNDAGIPTPTQAMPASEAQS